MLDRIDAVLENLCPCGAKPAPGSAYCGDDCTPTHRSVHTTSDTDGTQMRWRPDLVSEHDDSRLTLLNQFRRGPHNATVYEINGTDGVHCRLDDGNRFVGQDADGHQVASDEGLEPVWERLERELGNSRHLEPDPWADVRAGLSRWTDHVMFDGARHVADESATAAGRVFVAPAGSDPFDSTGWTELGAVTDDGLTTPVGDGIRVGPITWGVEIPPEVVRSFREYFARVDEFVSRAFTASAPPRQPEPDHPMLTAIEARRNRNTGPGLRPRAPRQINPRRGR